MTDEREIVAVEQIDRDAAAQVYQSFRDHAYVRGNGKVIAYERVSYG